jgi:hypothetical protein
MITAKERRAGHGLILRLHQLHRHGFITRWDMAGSTWIVMRQRGAGHEKREKQEAENSGCSHVPRCSLMIRLI